MSTVQTGSRRPRRDIRKIVGVLSAVALVAAVLIAVALASRGTVRSSASVAPASAKLVLGQKAPAFALSTTGGPFDLARNGGKPTFLEVFATWCPHCRREVAVLNKVYAAYGSRVNFVAVAGSAYGSDEQSAETQVDVVAFGTQLGARYPIAFDPTLAVANAYLQGGFPTMVTIDRDNVIRSVESGEITETKLEAELANTLAGKTTKTTE